MARQINDAGLQLIKEFEGFKANPYVDMVGKVTIGYGTTHYTDGTEVTMQDDPIDEPTASQLLNDLLNTEFCPGIEKAIKVTITDNQFAALVALAYNIGLGNFQQSTVLRCTNMKNSDDAARAFLLWDKGTVNGEKVVIPGLTRRRQAESDLFRS
jgi:lysozyme